MVGFLAHIPTAYVPFADSPLRWAGALLMPWIVLGLPLFGVALRMMRATMGEVLHEDYLRTAQAKGLRERTVVSGLLTELALAWLDPRMRTRTAQ